MGRTYLIEEIAELPGWQESAKAIGEMIGHKFRNRRLLSEDELMAGLTPQQAELARRLMYLQLPGAWSLPSFELEAPRQTTDYVVLKRELKNLKGEPVPDMQFVPKHIYKAFQKMHQIMTAEIGENPLIISSAYRSPAFQVLVMCYKLKNAGFDLTATLKMVTPPRYSEHCLYDTCALDLAIADETRIRADQVDAFASSREYRWLSENAKTYGFELSYPENNLLGMAFEPWHWRYFSE